MNSPPVRGSTTAIEIYLAVGVALSTWEACEDNLLDVFRHLRKESDPDAFKSYVRAPRNKRARLLRDAIRQSSDKFSSKEVSDLLTAMQHLERLAKTRNEIAHGHCSLTNSTEDGKLVMSGHYLLPSINDGHWHERELRYAHTMNSILSFVTDVSVQKRVVIHALRDARLRAQNLAGH